MEFSTTFGMPVPKRDAVSNDPSDPFHILVLGDFGARQSYGSPVRIDRDDFDDVFRKMDVNVSLALEPGAPELELKFAEFDDFHPDNLFDRLPLFESLRMRRARLMSAETFAEEAALIMNASGSTANTGPNAVDDDDAGPVVDAGDVLNMAVEQAQSRQKSFAEQIADGQLNIDDYVRQVVEPYVVAKADPRQAEFIAALDEAIADTMRKVLHHPKFQQLEAVWLGLRMLVRRLETDTQLKLSVVSVSKEQLSSDLSNDDLSRSQLYDKLVTSTNVAGAASWSVVIGNYVFDESAEDVQLLGRIADIQRAAGSIMIAGGSPTILGCPDLFGSPHCEDWNTASDEVAERWQALQSLPAARHVALMLPRLLARQPYGAKSSPIESFVFDEIPNGLAHEDYLWMNGAFGVGVLLGNAFSQAGWQMNSSIAKELDRMHLYIYEADGESKMKPCAEIELNLATESLIAERGLSAIYSIRSRDAVRIPAIRSLSSQDPSLAAFRT